MTYQLVNFLRKVFQTSKMLGGQRLPTQFERKAAIRNKTQGSPSSWNKTTRKKKRYGVSWHNTQQLFAEGEVNIVEYSGPYLFNIFLNDLEIKLGNETLGFKYADDCTIIAPVYDDIDHSADLINQFVRWAGQNRMNSNSTKCKELIMYKKRLTTEAYKGENFIYPMMHRFILYYQVSERTWSYQFSWVQQGRDSWTTVESDLFCR